MSAFKIITLVGLLLLMVVYFFVASFGFVMGAFCFDQGQSPGAWNCFAGINVVFSLPSLVCVLIAWVQFFRNRVRAALIVGALPLALIVTAYVALFVITSGMIGRLS